MLHLIRLTEARAIETPAAAMRTYASPSTPTRSTHAVWRTEVPADSSGPVHSVDTEHVVVVVSGELHATVDGESHTAATGDCLVLPAGSQRQLSGGSGGAITLTSAAAGSTATVGQGQPVSVPWAN